MNKEFILYEEALALKELGFNEECFWWYGFEKYLRKDRIGTSTNYSYFLENKSCSAPLYSQAFRWFREKGYDTKVQKESLGLYFGYYWTGAAWITIGSGSYEEAELACLKKLIEIVKNNE